MEQEKKGIYYGWWIVAACFVIYAMVYSTNSSGSVFTVAITEELGFKRSLYAMKGFFAAAGSVSGCFWMGKNMGKYDLKKLMIISTTILAMYFVAAPFATEIWQFYILNFFSGASYAIATMMSVPIVINNWFGPKKKGTAMSITLAGSGLGGMIMISLLGKLNTIYGWKTSYFIQAAIILITIIPLLLFVIVKTPKEKGLERLGESDVKQVKAGIKVGIDYKDAKKTPAFWMVALGFMLIAIINSGSAGHKIPYMSQVYNDPVKAAYIASLALGALMVGKLILGVICDKFGVRNGVLIGNIMYTLAIFSIYKTAEIPVMGYVYILFYGVGGAVGTVAIPLIISSIFGEKQFGKFLSTFNIAMGLGAPFGTVFCGTLFDIAGNYTTAWLILTIGAVVAVLLLYFCFSFKSWKKEKVEEKENGGIENARTC